MNDNKITVDGEEYEINSLSETAKTELMNLRLVDQEIQRLQIQLAIVQTARNAYAGALKIALPNKAISGDTISFS